MSDAKDIGIVSIRCKHIELCPYDMSYFTHATVCLTLAIFVLYELGASIYNYTHMICHILHMRLYV